MGLLKKIYIAWGGVFWGIIFLFSSLYAYFSDIEFFGDMLKIAFFIYSYPLLPYISYLTLQETIKSKNIFLYFSLFFFISGGFFNYVITLGIYTILFLIISIKFRKELSYYFSLLFCIFFIHFFVSFYFLKLTISKIMLNLYRLVFLIF
ncbi:hypothetical protein B11353_10900 [Campylobacter jejuni]|nr:hypothetical protein B10569_10240 [Campylobacter jejuni]BEK28162.1 hypothetical protein B11353_10900 [Campylobacter jejuni]